MITAAEDDSSSRDLKLYRNYADMQACTRCGHWHTDAERHMGRYLSCTEAKAFWSDLKRRHMEQTGHLAMIKISGDGRMKCVKCNQELDVTP